MAIKISVLGIDLGKNSCSLVGLDAAGAVVTRRRMRPQNIPAFTCSGLRLSAAGLAIIGDLGSRWVRLSGASGSGSVTLGSR